MAVLQRVAIYPNERFDAPDARALEAFSQNDWRFFLKGIWSSKSQILSGFEISNYANIFSVPGVKIQVNNAVILHSEATTQANGFYVAAGSEPDITLNLSPGATNFVEAEFAVQAGTPDTRAFWDTGADAGAGAEFTDTVDTVINLNLSISSNVSSFTPGKIKLYKFTTNPSGVVTSVTDCRPLFWRLGSGGSSPDPDSVYLWQNTPDADHAQFETPISASSATSFNAPFQGGDKNLKTFKDWADVLMSDLKKTKAVPYWYMDPQVSQAGLYQNSSMLLIMGGTFQHLAGTPGRLALTGGSLVKRMGQNDSSLAAFSSIDLAVAPALWVLLPKSAACTFGMGQDGNSPINPKRVSSVSTTSITVPTGGNYITGAWSIYVRGQRFSYTSYNASTGAFLGVSPDPSQLVKVNDKIYQAEEGVTGYYHRSSSADMPATTSNGVSEGVERCMWIAYYDGVNNIFLRNSELIPGEEIQAGDNTSAAIIAYIGSSGQADSFPVYGVNSIPDGTDLTDAIAAAFGIIETPIYDENIEYLALQPVDTIINLPPNSRNGMTPVSYTIGTGELEVYLDGVFWRVNKDYVEISSNQIKLLKEVQIGSSLHFRIATIGGSGAAAGGSSGNTLQDTYDNGRTITTLSTQPVVIQGPAGEKLLRVLGDVEITGVLDPTGLELTEVASNPLSAGKMGLWIKDVAGVKTLIYTKQGGQEVAVQEILEQVGGSAQNFSRTFQNTTGATIPAGAPVYIISPGQIALADASDNNAHIFLGITKTSIAHNASGEVIYSGVVPGIFTGMGFSSGYIWIGSTPGELSLVSPTTPGHWLVIAGLIDGDDLILQPQWNGQLS